MYESFSKRASEFQARLANANIDLALLTDPDSIYYLTGYWGYAGLEAGRPTLALIPRSGDVALITPTMEAEMCRAMTWVHDIRPWFDGINGEWITPLRQILGTSSSRSIGIERQKIPALIARLVEAEYGPSLCDASPILDEMRMVKSPEELETLRQSGQVAVAMVEAAEKVIGKGVPEYEVALAIIGAGTRKAASYLAGVSQDRLFTPMVYNLQILQSGPDTSMVHRRPTVRKIETGDPIYLCFCGIITYKNYKPGFDRQYFVGSVTDDQARAYEATIGAQAAALSTIHAGAVAEDVHFAAEAAYRSAGFAPAYRTGRAIGCSIIEKPEFKAGDKTRLKAGMTFAVDGGITLPGRYGTRVGDSIVVTETGFEYLTPYPKTLRVL